MKVLLFKRTVKATDHSFEDFLSGKSYAMSDSVAHQIISQVGPGVCEYIPFESIYKEYNGENLDGKSIAIWRTGGLGDLMFLNPMIRHIKRIFPTCELHLASAPRNKELFTLYGVEANIHSLPIIRPSQTWITDRQQLRTSR